MGSKKVVWKPWETERDEHFPVWKWIDEILELAGNSFLCFMFNKEKLCGIRVPAILGFRIEKTGYFFRKFWFSLIYFHTGECLPLWNSSQKDIVTKVKKNLKMQGL